MSSRKNKILLLCVALMLLISLVVDVRLAPTQTPTKPKVINWTMQLAYPSITAVSAVSMFGLQWAEAMEKITSGRLKIKVVEPGTFCGTSDLMSFLKKGVFDVGNGFPAFHAIGNRGWCSYGRNGNGRL